MTENQIRQLISTRWEGPNDEGEMRCVATLNVAGTSTLDKARYEEGAPFTHVAEGRAADMLVSALRGTVGEPLLADAAAPALRDPALDRAYERGSRDERMQAELLKGAAR